MGIGQLIDEILKKNGIDPDIEFDIDNGKQTAFCHLENAIASALDDIVDEIK